MKTVLRFGLLYGFIECLLQLIWFVTGINRMEKGWVVQLIPSLSIAVIFVMQAVKQYRLGEGNGFISFGKAFRTALGVLITGSILISGFNVVNLKFIDTKKMEIEFQRQIEKMEESGAPEESIDLAIDAREKYSKPFWLLTMSLLGSVFFSVVTALILAAVLKKENPEEIR